MVDLKAIRKSPLNGASLGNPKSVLIKEVPFLKSFDLRVDPESAIAATIEQDLKIKLPRNIGVATKNDFACLTLGPDWWLLVELPESKAQELQKKLINEYVSLVDVSSQRTCIEISGPSTKSVLQHAWEQDLDDVAFPVGACAQGLMARCPTIIHRTADTTYRLYVRSSFAQHLYRFLTDAATEYLN